MYTQTRSNDHGNNNKRVIIFDTTLRDGEQSPGASMNSGEKLRLAVQLEKLGVDVIEAGFPAASDGDFEAVSQIAAKLKRAQIAGLARATRSDIDRAWEAIKHAAHPRIHTFIATSDIHLEYKLRMGRDEVVQAAVDAVKHARSYTDNIEFSAEDGSRSDWDYLCRVFEAAIEAGATTINLPDTVGYAVPDEFAKMVQYISKHTPNIDRPFSAFTAMTTWVWPRPTPWRQFKPAPVRSKSPSTASVSGPAIPPWRKW